MSSVCGWLWFWSYRAKRFLRNSAKRRLAVGGAPLEHPRNRGNAAVDPERLEQRRRVIERHSIQSEFDRRRYHGNGRQRLEVIGQLPMDPRPEGAGSDLRLDGGGLHRHDQITFHLHDPAGGRARHRLPPCLLMPEVAAVADDEASRARQLQGDLRGRASSYDHPDTALPKGLLGLFQTFQHKSVVPQVGLRVIVGQAEDHHHPAAQPIRLLNAIFQCVVHLRALGLLHPVEDIAALKDVVVVQMPNACFVNSGECHDDILECCFLHHGISYQAVFTASSQAAPAVAASASPAFP